MYGKTSNQTVSLDTSLQDVTQVEARGINKELPPTVEKKEGSEYVNRIILIRKMIEQNTLLKQLYSKENQDKKIMEILNNIRKNNLMYSSDADINKYIQKQLSPKLATGRDLSKDNISSPLKYQNRELMASSGGRKTRKNIHKLTRKKYRKMKARKTRYQYKKHRYTRHKK